MSKDLSLKSNEKNRFRTVGYVSRILDSCAYHLFQCLQGTWAFQSLRLSQWPEEDQAKVDHSRVDDLESFYHVLFWVSLQHARHGLRPLQLHDVLSGLFEKALIDGDKAYSNAYRDSHMSSTRTIEKAKFQNPPLRELLLIISLHFKALYVSPPTPVKFESTLLAEMSQQAGESYQKELENYNKGLNRLNSKENSDWMEKSFEEALRFRDDKWGPTGYIQNEMEFPSAIATKRKYTDMTSSSLRYNQGGDFLPEQSAETDEGQDVIMNEDVDYEDMYESSGETREENNQASSSRRRLN